MRLFELTEGRYDPHTHKAIFMLGGPGSGKTHVSKKLIGGTGLRTVNVDEFYEMLRDKRSIQGRGFDDELYKYSGKLTQKKLDLLLKGRVGLLIDGTGRKVQRLSQMKDELESLGYDTMAVFVNTDINTALDRNEERRRKADTEWVRKVHADLQQKLGELQSMFGQNMLIVDNSEDRKDFANAQKAVDKFLNAPTKRPATWPVKEDSHIRDYLDPKQDIDPEELEDYKHDENQYWKRVAMKVMRDAKDYLSEVGTPVKLMYRGYERFDNYPFHRPYRENREPKDSGLYHQDLYNAAIDAAGGIADRSNSVFVSGNMIHARKYGEVYVVFPMGKFNYTYHLGIKDWYDKLGNILEGIAPAYFEDFEKRLSKGDPITVARQIEAKGEGAQQTQMLAQIFLKIAMEAHTDMALDSALGTDVEIMVSAPKGYYYIPEHYFFKYVRHYLEHAGIPVEDRQSRQF